ncbi:hypothetical protein [Granulicella arctica]|uniref:hypothetical protein n=1 Tax=Granulicella arctica TaxID=940613 RepID=UPI0021E05172|nr:hypothetical protein [Granulicella arctica]
MRSLEIAQVIGIASFITTVTALTLNILWSRRNRREASIRDRASFNAGFRKWADAVLAAMSAALHHWQQGEPITTELLGELSALIHQGRLFLLNEWRAQDQHSLEFPGLRPRMLDCIYYTYRFVQMPREGREVSEDWDILFRLQACFVRDAQRVMALDAPESNMEDLRKLLRDPEFLDTSQMHPAILAAYTEIERPSSISKKNGYR